MKKKKLLFTAYNLDIGGIETALINLLNNINYDKYEVTLILEKKEGIFLKDLNKNVILKEIKVSKCKLVVIRKLINFYRKLVFKIFNQNKFDFSCCYTTYSYSSNKLALIGSKNSSIYIHSNYKDVYETEEEIYQFFNTRSISNFRHIIFVSNESADYFKKIYKELSGKVKVFNNFINPEKIKELSLEKINVKKDKEKKLLVFVGRLDESSKKLTRAVNLVKKINDLNLWIIGDGQDRAMYEEIVKKEKLEKRILFFGKKKNPYPYMKKADYIILTSDYEGFPVTYLEALVLNKNIITTIPVSDDKINIKDYAYIISKDKESMVKEVEKIIGKKKEQKSISIEEIQKERIIELEKIFDND